MSAPAITIMVEEPLWRREGRSFLTDLRRTIRAALERVEKRSSAGLTVLLAGDTKLEELNRHHRGKARPTNVLSFPSADDAYLGDIAIAYGVTAREARDTGKTIHDHALHLAVHGALHLLGYDHETARQARIMEPLETAILAEFGIADPYATRPQAATPN
jgi:probable rRNA maturation factor